MGAALLSQPERIREILTKLVASDDVHNGLASIMRTTVQSSFLNVLHEERRHAHAHPAVLC